MLDEMDVYRDDKGAIHVEPSSIASQLALAQRTLVEQETRHNEEIQCLFETQE